MLLKIVSLSTDSELVVAVSLVLFEIADAVYLVGPEHAYPPLNDN